VGPAAHDLFAQGAGRGLSDSSALPAQCAAETVPGSSQPRRAQPGLATGLELSITAKPPDGLSIAAALPGRSPPVPEPPPAVQRPARRRGATSGGGPPISRRSIKPVACSASPPFNRVTDGGLPRGLQQRLEHAGLRGRQPKLSMSPNLVSSKPANPRTPLIPTRLAGGLAHAKAERRQRIGLAPGAPAMKAFTSSWLGAVALSSEALTGGGPYAGTPCVGPWPGLIAGGEQTAYRRPPTQTLAGGRVFRAPVRLRRSRPQRSDLRAQTPALRF